MGETSKGSEPGTRQLGADSDWEAVRDWRKATRDRLIAQRVGLSAQDRAAPSERISLALSEALEDCGSRVIGFYWPFRGEYDPRGVMTVLREQGTHLALPVIVARGQPLIFRAWSPGSLMTQGVWNVPMPDSGEEIFPEVLVVPLVGFDPQGYRLGYGGGFYDRTVAAMPKRPRTLGVGFAFGELDTIYPQPHDIALDRIITER